MTRIPPCGQRPLAVAFVQKHGQKEIQEGENPPLSCAWRRMASLSLRGRKFRGCKFGWLAGQSKKRIVLFGSGDFGIQNDTEATAQQRIPPKAQSSALRSAKKGPLCRCGQGSFVR